MKKYIFIFIGGMALFACSPETTETITETTDSEMPKSAIGEGKVTYLKKCASCHDLKKVEDYSTAQWANILPSMSKKAELTSEEESWVGAYIAWELEND